MNDTEASLKGIFNVLEDSPISKSIDKLTKAVHDVEYTLFFMTIMLIIVWKVLP